MLGGSSQDALRTRAGTGSRTVTAFLLQVLACLRNAAMNHLEKYRGSSFTGNESTVGFSINSTMDTLVMTSYLLLVLFFGLWV